MASCIYCFGARGFVSKDSPAGKGRDMLLVAVSATVSILILLYCLRKFFVTIVIKYSK